MKPLHTFLALPLCCIVLALSQTGCSDVYAPGPVAYGPSPVVPLYGWSGAGFYGGTYYGSSATY